MKKLLSYKNLTIAFIVVIVFAVSVSVAMLSRRTDSIEIRVDSLEQDMVNVFE